MVSATVESPISQALQLTFERLRQLNTQDIQAQWQFHQGDLAIEDIFEPTLHSQQLWQAVTLNDRQHIFWERGLHVLWLYQNIVVPHDLMGYPLAGLCLRIALTWWADDAQIYVDGQLIQSGDLFECFTRICLNSSVTPGQTFQIAIRLVSPGHDDGALVRSQLIYELPEKHPTPEPSFVADELTVLAILEPNTQAEIESAITQLNWHSLTSFPKPSDPNAAGLWQTLSTQAIPVPAITHPFQQSLSQLRRDLTHHSPKLKNRQIQCVGHAHLDMAWLWPISDTWKAAERTFQSILNLQKEFPELTYTHSSPALFEWIEVNKPQLFQQIQQKVQEGSWSIDAGLWIEPELNIIGGEAIVRQILYGQRYCQEKFGTISKIAWLPDTFGFCWQLPQLLTQGGIETFATLKLSWNDTTQFPHPLFWWQSPDGSRILSIMLPPIGTDIAPQKMAHHHAQWEQKTQSLESMWLPGLGDHGGGPTKDMLEKSRRWEKSPFFPQLKFTTPNQYIQSLASISPRQPTWNDELYLELHRGCYTTHADQKLNNRQCEDLLYQAEVFASIANLVADQSYPKARLAQAWKALLFNQFHDILPGTSIPDVFVEANKSWQKVKSLGEEVLENSTEAIISTLQLPQPPHPAAKLIIVFNSLNWKRSKIVKIKLPTSHSNWQIQSIDAQPLPQQIAAESQTSESSKHIQFLASDIPAVGYRYWWLCPSASSPTPMHSVTVNNVPEQSSESISEYILENEHIRATINAQHGGLVSLIQKSIQTELVNKISNQLQLFRDESGYWDAWNIAADYAEHPYAKPKVQSVQLIESGPLRQRLRIQYQHNKSVIIQDYVLDIHSPALSIENTIDWQETHTLLKVHFPTTISADAATYEMPFGAIERTTQPQTKAEKAKWEVPALRWADLSNGELGLSILTNSKHGFDAGPNHLRLTLLKSPTWPDPNSDKGLHHFSYNIYPHTGSWKSAHTVRLARAMNIPPLIHTLDNASTAFSTKCSAANVWQKQSHHSFLNIQNPNIILSAFKLSEDSNDNFILRCYETHGQQAELASKLNIANNPNTRLNILEQPISIKQPPMIQPWQVASYTIQKPDKEQ